MKIKEFYCDREIGTYMVALSKKETVIDNITVECTYKRANDKYILKLFIGLSLYDLMFEYSTKEVNCNYIELKNLVKIFISEEINKDTKEKLNQFIQDKVIPRQDYWYTSIGKIYEIVTPKDKKYHISVYTDKLDIIKDNELIKHVEGQYTIDDAVDFIREIEEGE